ncbi:MAG: hypothetical protein A4E19_07775 [Nitrospira sp. SG-bin1]|nr:MAG: hypothetical protein A4E19_07775 [Nitrospira sp. SG-bin1]
MNMGISEAIYESHGHRLGKLNADSAVADVPEDLNSFPSRRRETRMSEQKVCAYSLCESLDGNRVTIEQGEVYCINRSEHGILVLMGVRPRAQQLLELHVAETRWEYSLNLYEVQWSKIVPVEPHGQLFLVGCRLVFGASRYWTF